MSRVFFREELETVASYWRVYRRDGVTIGFTSHNRDLWFGGILHRTAPGMVPSAIRHTAGLTGDSAEMSGVLAHDAIEEQDLLHGKYDRARIEIGVIDWEGLEHQLLYCGRIGQIATDDGQFTAELRSAKSDLEQDLVPRTSPTCRARFCGPSCNLSAARFTRFAAIGGFDPVSGWLIVDANNTDNYLGGTLRWLGGPLAGQSGRIINVAGTNILLDSALPDDGLVGAPIILREGCDHRLITCDMRFGNAVNFRGEPFLPGNDLLVRSPENR